MVNELLFGIDALLSGELDSLKSQRIGLVTNNVATTTGVTPLQDGNILPPFTPTRAALQRAGLNLVALFSPEHGLGANVADGAQIGDSTDLLTELPIYSLYGDTFRPTPAMLSNLDLLLFDIPDIGARFYTYIWTLSHVMEACADVGLPLWVLDRPNPVGGKLTDAEGPLLDEEQVTSFVGRWSMPVRHSLTVGELAQMWNGERGLDVDLTVIPVQGWQRERHWPQLGLSFVPTSPAMPSYETALLYLGTCFLEGTNLSEGRGTATPFRAIGAPWVDGLQLTVEMNALQLPGVVTRSVQFGPNASKHQGETCNGIMLHVTDTDSFRPVATGLHLLATIIRMHPREFVWLPYPTAANRNQGYGHFDRLIGRLDIRRRLNNEAEDVGTIWDAISNWTVASQWVERVEPYLLY